MVRVSTQSSLKHPPFLARIFSGVNILNLVSFPMCYMSSCFQIPMLQRRNRLHCCSDKVQLRRTGVASIKSLLIFIVHFHTAVTINTLQLWCLQLSISIFWFFHCRSEPEPSGSFTSQLQVYRYQTKPGPNPTEQQRKTKRTEPAQRRHTAAMQWKQKPQHIRSDFPPRNPSCRDEWKCRQRDGKMCP